MKYDIKCIYLVICTLIISFFFSSTPAWCTVKKPEVNTRVESEGFAAATVLRPGSLIADFSLQDSMKRSFNLQSLKGHWTLLYFGYADCPDICPRSLTQIAEIYQIFSKQDFKNKPRFIFASLNPSIDEGEKLRELLSRFNPEFIGITGNESEMNKLSQSCRVHSWTAPKPNANGKKVIDHSAAILLINPIGRLQAIFSPPLKPQDIAMDIQKLLNS